MRLGTVLQTYRHVLLGLYYSKVTGTRVYHVIQ